MTFYSYLKAARERCGITQSDLAEKMQVSTTTIQNWEKDTLPDKGYWQTIIEQLKLSQDDFLKYYGKAVLPRDSETEVQPFPDFLFPESMLDQIKSLRLTEEEQELLGLEEIYCDIRNMYGEYHFTIAKQADLPDLPYEYVRRVGAFHIMNLDDSLSDKVGEFRNYIIEQIKKAPDETFDIMKCSPAQLLNLCDYIKIITKKSSSYYSSDEYYIWGEKIPTILNLLMKIEDAEGSLPIAETYDDNSYHSSKWRKLDDYSDFVGYDGDLCYNQFMQHVEKECEDAEYIASIEKYEKDMLYYEEHSSMLDHKPEKPKYKGTNNVEMTERGRQLLTWYETNFPEKD